MVVGRMLPPTAFQMTTKTLWRRYEMSNEFIVVEEKGEKTIIFLRNINIINEVGGKVEIYMNANNSSDTFCVKVDNTFEDILTQL